MTTHMQKFDFNSQSALKIQWKQPDGQTGGGDSITCHISAVGNKGINQWSMKRPRETMSSDLQ